MMTGLLPGAAAEIPCVGSGGSPCFPDSESMFTCPNDEDCTLTCSGDNACNGFTINGPSHPHSLAVQCTGDHTCKMMKIRAEAAAAVSFSCDAGTGDYCGHDTIVFCPGCVYVKQNGAGENVCEESCAAGSSSSTSTCTVMCTATIDGQQGTCASMKVYSGPGGADIQCKESGTSTTSRGTCSHLKVHHNAAAMTTSFDCAVCTGEPADPCCSDAEVTPGNRHVACERTHT